MSWTAGRPGIAPIARNAIAITCYKIATTRNYDHMPLAGYCSGIGDLPMRMFETVTSTMLAIAAQALVVGVVITAF
ncbi:hypothetical protein IFT67_06500 [Sphingomonas sp. CFBP 13728]|uniref:hypothetical protein n=1 Tax=Sphingomonas sp. CFBP 13728 TaxID=2775294 RepID=UPI001785F5FE|nr:hypothetical protein [Sphingomonas sp. CFBP 13728]MBD8618568.1 hypothetical protein [Sphingomonas sp. CFBP 13728]